MTEIRHRATCRVCSASWSENCLDCAEDNATRHRRETGHPVELTITQEVPSMATIMERMRSAREILYEKRGRS